MALLKNQAEGDLTGNKNENPEREGIKELNRTKEKRETRKKKMKKI